MWDNAGKYATFGDGIDMIEAASYKTTSVVKAWQALLHTRQPYCAVK